MYCNENETLSLGGLGRRKRPAQTRIGLRATRKKIHLRESIIIISGLERLKEERIFNRHKTVVVLHN